MDDAAEKKEKFQCWEDINVGTGWGVDYIDDNIVPQCSAYD